MRCFTVLAALLVAYAGSAAHADGVYIPKIDPASHARDITEPQQKAVVVWAGGKERLMLQVSYKGDVSEFAWLVPTPSKPDVSKFDEPIFHELHETTSP